MWLQRLGAQVTGIALPPATQPNLFELARVTDGMDSHFGDIRGVAALATLMRQAQPDAKAFLAEQGVAVATARAGDVIGGGD